MKMFKTIPVFILLFTGYLCNAQDERTTSYFLPPKYFTASNPTSNPSTETPWGDYASDVPATEYFTASNPTSNPSTETPWGDYAPDVPDLFIKLLLASNPESILPSAERSLPSLVVAGVSIALVLLCILIVAIFWYAWKKSQEGSIELNPLPYGEAGVSLRNLSVPENQQEWPFERAVQ